MFEKTKGLIFGGVGKLYPSVAYAFGVNNTVLESDILGNRAQNPASLPATRDTLFDLASLTKIVCTTMVALKFIEQGKLCLNDKISKFLDNCSNFQDCEIRELLTHSSGLSAWEPLFKLESPDEVLSEILKSEPQQTQANYSCMGYIVLGKILEKIGGESLDKLAENEVSKPLKMNDTMFNPDKSRPIASCEKDEQTGEYLTGIVHDENARYLSGVAGNAGVFSTLDDMIIFAKMCACAGKANDNSQYLSTDTFEKATTNYTPNDKESRGLGFQLKGAQPFSGGDNFSVGSFGHTGYTGTSMYIDKQSGLWGVLLTNAVHYGRAKKPEFNAKRKEIFNTLLDEYKNLLKEKKI